MVGALIPGRRSQVVLTRAFSVICFGLEGFIKFVAIEKGPKLNWYNVLAIPSYQELSNL